jgi:hypothetical protein
MGRWEGKDEKDVEEGTGACIMSSLCGYSAQLGENVYLARKHSKAIEIHENQKYYRRIKPFGFQFHRLLKIAFFASLLWSK